jgi:hypothetical protein
MRITSRQLRSIIRRELLNEVELSNQVTLGPHVIETRKRNYKKVKDALLKTYKWFVYVGANYPDGKVTADQNYFFEFSFYADVNDGNTCDVCLSNMADPENWVFIKKGTQFKGLNDKQVMGGGLRPDGSAAMDVGQFPYTLPEIYKILKGTIENNLHLSLALSDDPFRDEDEDTDVASTGTPVATSDGKEPT